ncbi:hypothetical protein E4U21_006078 [Claviceps maximensis]|nr:hypothetical protein E4U21_006078 [Claviceps maximensis]
MKQWEDEDDDGAARKVPTSTEKVPNTVAILRWAPLPRHWNSQGARAPRCLPRALTKDLTLSLLAPHVDAIRPLAIFQYRLLSTTSYHYIHRQTKKQNPQIKYCRQNLLRRRGHYPPYATAFASHKISAQRQEQRNLV